MASQLQIEADVNMSHRARRLLHSWRLRLFVLTLSIGALLILSFNVVIGRQVAVTLGEPSPVDVIAPFSKTYVSDVLTQERREQAAIGIADIYTPPDRSVGRAQTNRARAVFNFIEVVRADGVADHPAKVHYLQAIEGLTIEQQVAQDLLNFNQADYAAAKADTLGVIETAMRNTITGDDLNDARRSVRGLVSFELSPAQERVVTTLAPQFVVLNSTLDEGAIAQRQSEVEAAVAPVTQIVTKDERIIRVGDVIDAADLEMLAELGLLQWRTDWRQAVSFLIASLLAAIVLALYWQQFHNGHEPNRNMALLIGLLLLFLLIGRLMVVGGGLLLYFFAAAAMAMLLTVIFDARMALTATAVLAVLVGLMGPNSLELAMYTAVGSALATLTIRDAQRVNAFFRAGLMAGAGNVAVILIFHLTGELSMLEMLELVIVGLANGLISASLTLAGLFVIGSLFGITTTLQLQELSRLDHPLLQELLRRAPGTYHHSIMVANLAEQAAERIKANSTLVRVGAFYHDVGKMNRPPFFSENQERVNPHDTLDPYSSARIIKSHVTDGLDLARKYHLPYRIRDFIAEHHGDRVLKAFHKKAIELADGDADKVDVGRFRYPGPRPRSKETAIVQLADCLEATSTAVRPDSEAAIEKLVNSIMDDHLKEGQLDQSGLTLDDIQRARASFIDTLKGRFHVRVQYPGDAELLPAESSPMPATLPERRSLPPRPEPTSLLAPIHTGQTSEPVHR